MPGAPSYSQPDVFTELGIADCLDDAVGMARRMLRQEFLVFWIVALVATLGCSLWFACGAWSDLMQSGAPSLDPRILLTASGLRLLLAMLQVVLTTDTAWHAFEGTRGALPAGASRRLTLLRAIILSPVVAAWAFLPQALFLWGALLAGDTALLPAAWMQPGFTLQWVPVFMLGLLVWPAACMAPAVLVVEGSGPLRALVRSARLVFASRGQAHGIQGAFLLIHVVLGWGLANLLLLFIREPATLGGSSDPLVQMLLPSLFSAVLISAVALVVEMLLLPQRGVAWFLSYINVRVRREGLDVERGAWRAGLLSTDPAP